jgi:hypothetical protein
MKRLRKFGPRDYGPIPVKPATPDAPPEIRGSYGVTAEQARLQAAHNMRVDPQVFERVLTEMKRRMGSRKKAIVQLKKMYPEVFAPRVGEEDPQQ